MFELANWGNEILERAKMSETIVVDGRECFFTSYPRGIAVTNCDGILGGAGRWHHKSFAMDGDYHPTEAAAREFAAKFADAPADQPAGGEASGCELPGPCGWWQRISVPEHVYQLYESTDGAVYFRMHDAETGEQMRHGSRMTNIVRGGWVQIDKPNWHPAPASELAELRAEVERLREAAKCGGFEFVPVPGGYTCIPQAPQVLVSANATLTAKLAAAERERDEPPTFLSWDNSDPPQLWEWTGPHDESAEPVRRVKCPPHPASDELAELRDQLQTVHRHVAEAIELLGVDTSVATGRIPDSWTLREECHAAGLKLAELRAEVERLTKERDGIFLRLDESRKLFDKPIEHKSRLAVLDKLEDILCGADIPLDSRDLEMEELITANATLTAQLAAAERERALAAKGAADA